MTDKSSNIVVLYPQHNSSREDILKYSNSSNWNARRHQTKIGIHTHTSHPQLKVWSQTQRDCTAILVLDLLQSLTRFKSFTIKKSIACFMFEFVRSIFYTLHLFDKICNIFYPSRKSFDKYLFRIMFVFIAVIASKNMKIYSYSLICP